VSPLVAALLLAAAAAPDARPDPAIATTVEREAGARPPPRADDRDAAILRDLDLLEELDLLENLELFGVDSTAR